MCDQTVRTGCAARAGRCQSRCGRAACCSCGSDAPTATISMADYEPFILVPTSVFDQGDVGCDGCGAARCGYGW